MKIGIIGTGNMGRSLGLVWAERSHEVFFGARDPAKAKAAADLAVELSGDTEAGQRHGSNAQAARFGDVLLYTARGVPPAEALGETDANLLAGKIVIDMNNQEVPGDFVFPPIIRSLAETLADLAPGARVIKAFNTMAQEVFELCPDAIRSHRGGQRGQSTTFDDFDLPRRVLDACLPEPTSVNFQGERQQSRVID